MSTNYFKNKLSKAKLFLFKSSMSVAILLAGNGYSQQSYTFTNCGATGSVGPSQTMVNNSYTATSLSGSVTALPTGIQQWTVPISGGYRIEAFGASGGGAAGGLGASMAGDFSLTAGQVLNILVGQQGLSFLSDRNISGGGGSYVVSGTNSVLVIAGGGGAARTTYTTAHGLITTTAEAGYATVSAIQGSAGIAGSGGGGAACRGGGGAGWVSNGGIGLCGGAAGNGGTVFINGGYGGSVSTASAAAGGFGGGGSSEGTNNAWTYSGGGGGYSGGGGASNGDLTTPRGGGGGSINTGTNQLNAAGVNAGHGKVIITELCNISLSSSATNSLSPLICSGNSLTLTTNAVSGYQWSNGNTTSSVIVVTPTVTTVYSVTGTSNLACTASAFITVNVSPGTPTLSIASTTNNICIGQSVTFTASGAVTYTWTGGITNGVAFSPTVSNVYTVNGTNGCGTSSASISLTASPLPVNIASSSTLLCSGTIATLSAVSAANAYTWQPIVSSSSVILVSPFSTTVYSLTASNGTCSGFANLTITALPLPTVTAVASSGTVCTGKTVTLTAGGGINYTWTPGNLSGTTITVTPNSPTQYSVTGDDAQGCLSGASQIILTSPTPTLLISTNDPLICQGASSTLTVSGASSYMWNTSASSSVIVVNPNQQAVYTVTGTSAANCSETATVLIDVFVPPVAITGNTSICAGETASLTATGATSYSWSTGMPGPVNFLVPPVTTSYTLSTHTQTGNLSCFATTTVLVVVKVIPNVNVTSDRLIMCRNEQVTVTASGANTYSWNTSETTSNIILTPTLITTLMLNVTGISSNGCSNTASIAIVVNNCTDLSEHSLAQRLSVYPNPAREVVNITSDFETEFWLINELGQRVLKLELNAKNAYKASVSGLSNGIYFITDSNSRMNRKIIINN